MPSKPDVSIKGGRCIQAAAWLKEGKKGKYWSMRVTRSYKDEHDQWQKQSISLVADDIGQMIAVLQELQRNCLMKVE